jgi:hypothetical protein
MPTRNSRKDSSGIGVPPLFERDRASVRLDVDEELIGLWVDLYAGKALDPPEREI